MSVSKEELYGAKENNNRGILIQKTNRNLNLEKSVLIVLLKTDLINLKKNFWLL